MTLPQFWEACLHIPLQEGSLVGLEMLLSQP